MGGLSGSQYVFDKLEETFLGHGAIMGYEISILRPYQDSWVPISTSVDSSTDVSSVRQLSPKEVYCAPFTTQSQTGSWPKVMAFSKTKNMCPGCMARQKACGTFMMDAMLSSAVYIGCVEW